VQIGNVEILGPKENTMNGTVIRLTADKGFGFIKGDDNKDYFFHRSDLNGFFDDLVRDFSEGRKIHVTFDSAPSLKGPRAANVVRVDGGV
jgi:cold shock protein